MEKKYVYLFDEGIARQILNRENPVAEIEVVLEEINNEINGIIGLIHNEH